VLPVTTLNQMPARALSASALALHGGLSVRDTLIEALRPLAFRVTAPLKACAFFEAPSLALLELDSLRQPRSTFAGRVEERGRRLHSGGCNEKTRYCDCQDALHPKIPFKKIGGAGPMRETRTVAAHRQS
jgi:hypothetical protein